MTPKDEARRIHIVGGPGSGKTTLAVALARHFGVAVHDLDDVALTLGVETDFRPKCPLSVRESRVRAISERPGWVSEGSYLWWTENLFERAHAIVWLDVPWTTALRRIFVRHLRAYVTDIAGASHARSRFQALRHPHLTFLVRFVLWAVRYYTAPVVAHVNTRDPDDMRALTRAATRAQLGHHSSKVVHVRGNDVAQVIAELHATAMASSLRPSKDGARHRSAVS